MCLVALMQRMLALALDAFHACRTLNNEALGQDASTSGAADAPLPEAPAPQGFWAAVAALLCMARVELMRMGLAMGLAEALPASALQAVRFCCCVSVEQ